MGGDTSERCSAVGLSGESRYLNLALYLRPNTGTEGLVWFSESLQPWKYAPMWLCAGRGGRWVKFSAVRLLKMLFALEGRLFGAPL